MANHTYLMLAEREVDGELRAGYTIHDSHAQASRFDWKSWESFYRDLPTPRDIWQNAIFHTDFGGADMLTNEDGSLLMDENNPEVPMGTDDTPSYCFHFENAST